MPKPRKDSNEKPLKTLRIFCEGEQTEPNYLKGFIKTLDDGARRLVEDTNKNTPVQLVNAAIAFKDSPNSLPDDEFWVVYDRESTAKYSDTLHAEARQKAASAGIQIAICNVCFEYWLLLHFVDTDAPYSSCDDLMKNSALKGQFKQVCGHDYDKSARFLFDKVKEYIPEARERAQRLNNNGKQNADPTRSEPHHINPYVGIVELLDAIDAFT
jgi:RloB-like protein